VDSGLPFSHLARAAEALQRGEVSSVELTNVMLARIERLNPRIGAITDTIAESARREAERADLLRKSAPPSALSGVPIAVKDIIDTTPAICSAGLPFLANYRPARDATVVRRLRRAGAVILAVTATDPGAFGVRTAAVTHPQDPSLTVGGSSGGSGAALAAGLCFGALGTDTGGSIRVPAACCSIAGLKPTRGRIPLDGVRPLVWSLDHVGPMARRVEDLACLQPVLDRHWTKDRDPERGHGSIGHDPDYYRDCDEAVRSGIAAALKACRSLGYDVREVALPPPDDILPLHLVIFSAESAAYHRSAFPDKLDEYPPFVRRFLDLHENHTGADYVAAMRQRREITRRVEKLFDGIDWLILPTLPVPTPPVRAETIMIAGREIEFTPALVRYTCLFDHTGHPVVAMPAKSERAGRAASVQVIGPLARDDRLLLFAARLERALNVSVDYSFQEE
jgi:Asp-tRNA(Asn)/Glu-tRNA(Gln) amidotransferase A subunit family amidase